MRTWARGEEARWAEEGWEGPGEQGHGDRRRQDPAEARAPESGLERGRPPAGPFAWWSAVTAPTATHSAWGPEGPCCSGPPAPLAHNQPPHLRWLAKAGCLPGVLYENARGRVWPVGHSLLLPRLCL